MTDHHYRRRETDRAQERAARAALLGDQVAYIVATARAEAARRRREAWDGERANPTEEQRLRPVGSPGRAARSRS